MVSFIHYVGFGIRTVPHFILTRQSLKLFQLYLLKDQYSYSLNLPVCDPNSPLNSSLGNAQVWNVCYSQFTVYFEVEGYCLDVQVFFSVWGFCLSCPVDFLWDARSSSFCGPFSFRLCLSMFSDCRPLYWFVTLLLAVEAPLNINQPTSQPCWLLWYNFVAFFTTLSFSFCRCIAFFSV